MSATGSSPSGSAAPSLLPPAVVREFNSYLTNARAAHKHPAKLAVLTRFLNDFFSVKLDELLPGIEAKIGSRILGVRGSIDLVFSDVVVELKTDFLNELEDGKNQLIKYFQALHEADPSRAYVGIVTDLLQFEAFTPVFSGPRVTGLSRVGQIDAGTASPEDSLLWIDAFFFHLSSKVPTAEELRWKFGIGTPTYAVVTDELARLWSVVSGDAPGKLKRELWSRAIEIVYGHAPDDSAFFSHTYLATIAKLLVYLRLSGQKAPSTRDVVDALSGRYFVTHGLVNLIEDDFFTWILQPKIEKEAAAAFLNLSRSLARYDLSGIDEDLFKELYENIIEAGVRHRVGEFYTPRWLCQATLAHVLEPWNRDRQKGVPRILDPACGSGSFLTAAIHEIRRWLNGKPDAFVRDTILASVVGVDINPMAVTISKANYFLAMGDLAKGGSTIFIPVFVADSVKIEPLRTSLYGGIRALGLTVDGRRLEVPRNIFSDSTVRSQVFSALSESIAAYRERHDKKEASAVLGNRLTGLVSQDELDALINTGQALLRLEDKGRDSVWVFVLNNLYAPSLLKEEGFDILVGNPPWLGMKSIESHEYQSFLKAQVSDYELMDPGAVELYPHLEMSTYFYVRTSDLYLRSNGTISFLLPISVTTAALHHARFQQFRKPVLHLDDVVSYEGVPDIFSLPVCVFTATKGSPTKYPVPFTRVEGKLQGLRRNEDWTVVEPLLTRTHADFSPAILPTAASPYYSKFREGAAIVPHNFWYVELVVHPALGLNVARPLMRTSGDVNRVAKKPWKGLQIEKPVEVEYLFASVLGKDLVPFGHLPPRPIVLPAKFEKDSIRLLDVSDLRAAGSASMADWLQTAQGYWSEKATPNAKKNTPRIIDWIDYHAKLSGQNPSKRYVVGYNARGADSFAVVLDRLSPAVIPYNGRSLTTKGYVFETTLFYFETNVLDEAHYLAAVLNSPTIHKAVKPFQPKGKYGYRDIGRRPLQLAIPEFNPSDADHKRMVEISKACHLAVKPLTDAGGGFRTVRNRVRIAIKTELQELSKLADF